LPFHASGQIVESYDAPNGTHGLLFDQGIYSTIDVPGSTSTSASGINNSGQIVGSYDVAGPYNSHGFLLDSGNYTTLDVPGSTGTYATGINKTGQIVGHYRDAAGNVHGFLFDSGSYTTAISPLSAGARQSKRAPGKLGRGLEEP
jgi:probable HAF family extracellular repeat protein